MVESEWTSLFEKLTETRCQIAMVCSGGGAGGIARCFRRPGASRNFVESTIPYSRAAMKDYLGAEPVGPSASVEVAAELARKACDRARRLSDSVDSIPVGVALVAALPTIPVREGQDQIHAAIRSTDVSKEWSTELTEGQHDRDSAEAIAEQMICRALKELVG